MAKGDDRRRSRKSAAAFRTISEAAGELDIPAHVLRFWETKFVQVKPLKRGGGRRYYRPEDVDLLRGIRELLYTDGYTIKGVQKLLREGGVKDVTLRVKNPDVAAPIDPEQVEVGQTPQNSPLVAVSLDDTKRAELVEVLGELETLRDILKNAAA